MLTIVDGVTTAYPGDHYEYEVGSGIARQYYAAGGARVAMRVSGDPEPSKNGVFYTLGDHLGSTSITVDESGMVVAELRYKAWGETRYANGDTPTTWRYTGQRQEEGLGLYYYRARWYDPVLGRFTQADTIVPNPTNPQSLNRYTYVNNNPVRFTDPSGHKSCDGPNGDLCVGAEDDLRSVDKLLADYGIVVPHWWSQEMKSAVHYSAYSVGKIFSETTGGSAAEAFRKVYGVTDGREFVFDPCPDGQCAEKGLTIGSRLIWINGFFDSNSNSFRRNVNFITHELGHAFENRLDLFYGRKYGRELVSAALSAGLLPKTKKRNKSGYFGLALTWQMNNNGEPGEVFADQFIGWVFNKWEENGGVLAPEGHLRSDFMNTHMPDLIELAANPCGSGVWMYD